jgi:hypothetical protein
MGRDVQGRSVYLESINPLVTREDREGRRGIPPFEKRERWEPGTRHAQPLLHAGGIRHLVDLMEEVIVGRVGNKRLLTNVAGNRATGSGGRSAVRV